MIIALAGRRVDAENAKEPRFPSTPENIERVRSRLRALFEEQRATVLVSSAACGADLLALAEARRLGLRCRVVLPYAREKFQASSVDDRPGNWGHLYNEILDAVEKNGDLVVLQAPSDDPYAEATRRILEEAMALGRELQEKVSAVQVWDGQSRGPRDYTDAFGRHARSLGLPVLEVRTV